LRAHAILNADTNKCWNEKGKKRWGKTVLEYMSLELGDCSRNISLEFPTGRSSHSGKHDKRECANSLRKANILLDYINEIITELEKEV